MRRQLLVQLDLGLAQLERAQHHRRPHDLVEVGDRAVERRLAREREQVVDDLGDPVRVAVDRLEVALRRRILLDPAQQLGEEDDPLERVVDLAWRLNISSSAAQPVRPIADIVRPRAIVAQKSHWQPRHVCRRVKNGDGPGHRRT